MQYVQIYSIYKYRLTFKSSGFMGRNNSFGNIGTSSTRKVCCAGDRSTIHDKPVVDHHCTQTENTKQNYEPAADGQASPGQENPASSQRSLSRGTLTWGFRPWETRVKKNKKTYIIHVCPRLNETSASICESEDFL